MTLATLLVICQFLQDRHENSGLAIFLVLFDHEQRPDYAPAYWSLSFN